LAEELVRLDVKVIITATPDATRAAMQVTHTIPIVTVAHDHDPVATGFIQSFSRPGGNVTGLTIRNTQLAAKRLELLKEAIPSLTHVAAFRDSFGSREAEPMSEAAGRSASSCIGSIFRRTMTWCAHSRQQRRRKRKPLPYLVLPRYMSDLRRSARWL
jgi:putative ABC transport system substrate-binding protein